jgi:hypothetical protein
MQRLYIGGQYRSGLSGFPIPQSRDVEEEHRLVRWLNDDWAQSLEQMERLTRGEGRKDPLPDMPNDEDAPARRTILKEFLPRLLKVQAMPESATEALRRGRQAMKKSPGKYRDEDDAASDVCGIYARAELVRILSKHSITPTIPTPTNPVKLLVKGSNMTEVWAMYILLQMASDGILEQLAQCACGCEKWFIRKRTIDRFASTTCRVRSHQMNPSIKKIRRAKARESYHRERSGIVATGWKKAQ